MRLERDAATLLFEVSTSRFSFSHMSFEDFREPLRLSYSLPKKEKNIKKR